MNNKFQFPDLETSRTNLRLLKPEDTDSLFKHFSDQEVTEHMDIDVLTSREKALEIIEFHINGSGCRWGIFDKDNNELMGTCGYHCWDRHSAPELAEVGYDLSKTFWGQGLMKEVLCVVIPFAFEKMKLEKIQAECTPNNDRSIGLLERLGFILARKMDNGQKLFYLTKVDWNLLCAKESS